MYHKFGFVEYGRLPEGVLHHQAYVDTVYMYRKCSNTAREERIV
jgi:hypothetical protein